MEVEHIHNNIRYTLSNNDLKVKDEVYPIGRGRIKDNNSFILHGFDWKDFSTGFPDEPHTILDLKHNGGTYKPYEIRTNMGFGPVESYYKIVKKEKQFDRRHKNAMFSNIVWEEIK